jgi:hypothetical protein
MMLPALRAFARGVPVRHSPDSSHVCPVAAKFTRLRTVSFIKDVKTGAARAWDKLPEKSAEVRVGHAKSDP